MNALIGDIGNTTTKICLIEIKTFKIKKIIYFNSNNISSKNFLKKNLKKIIKKNPINKIALFSSVVPSYQLILKKFLKKNYRIELKEIKEKAINKIVKINIKNKNQVGSDRIANAAGVYKKYKANCIVLDFGTATTFDVVTKKGIYNGGVIAPGLNLSIKTLSSSADQIPIFDGSALKGLVTIDIVNEYSDRKDIKIKNVMNPKPPLIDASEPANALSQLIRISGCALVEKNSKIIGIITSADLLKTM